MRWDEETVARIAIDPFSTITVAPQLVVEHEPAMSTEEWIRANGALISAKGAETWLRQLLDALEGKKSRDDLIDPYNVVNIAPRFAVEHEPIISKDLWIGANSNLITRELGVERWLTQFLDILESGIPTTHTPGYQPLRHSSFPLKGKRRNKKRKYKK